MNAATVTKLEEKVKAEEWNPDVRRDILRALFSLRLMLRFEESLALCPDHRGKANGRCIACVAEERTKQEERERRAFHGS